MEEVTGHGVSWRSIERDEEVREIEVGHPLLARPAAQSRMDVGDCAARGCVGSATGGKWAADQDVRLRLRRAQLIDDGIDPGCDIGWTVTGTHVVDSDLKHDHTRSQWGELTSLQAEQHMLRAIAGDSERGGCTAAEVSIEGANTIGACTAILDSSQRLRDGVAQEQDFEISIAGGEIGESPMLIPPRTSAPSGCRGAMLGRRQRRCRHARLHTGQCFRDDCCQSVGDEGVAQLVDGWALLGKSFCDVDPAPREVRRKRRWNVAATGRDQHVRMPRARTRVVVCEGTHDMTFRQTPLQRGLESLA